MSDYKRYCLWAITSRNKVLAIKISGSPHFSRRVSQMVSCGVPLTSSWSVLILGLQDDPNWKATRVAGYSTEFDANLAALKLRIELDCPETGAVLTKEYD